MLNILLSHKMMLIRCTNYAVKLNNLLNVHSLAFFELERSICLLLSICTIYCLNDIWGWHGYYICLNSVLLGIITKKDILRHITQLQSQDSASILFSWLATILAHTADIVYHQPMTMCTLTADILYSQPMAILTFTAVILCCRLAIISTPNDR